MFQLIHDTKQYQMNKFQPSDFNHQPSFSNLGRVFYSYSDTISHSHAELAKLKK